MDKQTKENDKRAETPEPPQIMNPSSSSERKAKMQREHDKKQDKPAPKRRSKKKGK